MIVLIDDKEANRNAVARYLREAGYQVQEGSSGHEALALAQHQPDLMILDTSLPDASGIDICQQLRRNPNTSNLLILQTSAPFTSNQDRVLGLESGADACLSAPFEPRELLAQVRALLRIRESESALRQREERFRSFFLDNPDPFFAMDQQGQFVLINAACEVLSGYAAAELLKMTYLEICAPDQRDRTLAIFQKGLSERIHQKLETAILRKDGQRVELLVSCTPWLQEDQVAQFYCIATDITDRKLNTEALRQSEARYRELVQNANSAIIRWRVDGTITFFNEFAQRFFGYREDEVLGRHVSLLVPSVESDGKDLSNLIHDITEHPEQYAQNINENLCRDGRRVWMGWTNKPLFDEQGQLMEILAVGGDITERKQAEDEVRRLNAELEERVQMRTADLRRLTVQLRKLAKDLTFSEERQRQRTALVLHDNLQQLLVAAQLRLESLRKQGKNKRGGQALEWISDILKESIQVSRSLTYDLSPPVLQESNLAAALRWLGSWFEKQHGLEVQIEADETVDVSAEELRITLFRSVQELLFNVVKHAQVKTAQVTVGQIPDQFIEIMVSDNGRGLDPIQLSTQEDMDNGFGLFHMREQLESLGGQLRIDSAPGRGSRFTLLVPIHAIRLPAQPESGISSAFPIGLLPPCDSAEKRKINVMLADDHRVMREGLVRVVQEHKNIEVVGQAADGQQAVELAHALQPDVILMDVSMPKLNGIEATRIIRTMLPHIKVIGLSMFEDEAHNTAMRNAGALALLRKSGSAADLVTTILDCVNSTG